ncbi:CHAT domain-containing protein [Streptomyces sp. cf386]|uniref:SCO5717 family growth-regulating ATPase n=1 Tax=Streptomyces sp. cf386 TaxID=1761904 RepID=UPI00088AEF52|nr:SCO5717 family growth-regulating ATPase [Streptomyces sp. cf386]SDN19296.1 CHAT domain-containing protein [Streptomyces sp. cf386]
MAEDADAAAGGAGPTGPLLREYSPTGGVPPVSAQRTSVVFYRNGGYSVVTAFGVRHVDKPMLARPVTVCEIAVGTFVTPLRIELPAAGSTAFFKAEVDIQWKVDDPHLVAVQAVTDVAKRLTSPILERLGEVTRSYLVTDAEQANRVITRECIGGRWSDLGAELGLRVRLYVRLGADNHAIEHAKNLRGVETAVTRERQEVFRRMLHGEELEQLSFMLAADPAGAKDFLEKIRQEGRQDEKDRVAQLFAMAVRGELATVDMEAQVLNLLNPDRRHPIQGTVGSAPAPQERPRRRRRAEDDGWSWAEEADEADEPSTRPRKNKSRTPAIPSRDRDNQPSAWAVPAEDDHRDAESAVELTGELDVNHTPPAWYTQNSSEDPSKEVSGRSPEPPPDDAAVRSGPSAFERVVTPPPRPPMTDMTATGDWAEPHQLVAELAEQTSPGREVPLHVQIVRGTGRGGRAVQPLRPLFLPPDGARVLITIHAPGLVVIDELQQELDVMPGRDSDVLLFRLKAPMPGLHRVTVRAFRGGTFLGEVTCQLSVGHGGVTRDGPQRHVPLPSMAFDPGEVTLQVLKDEAAGTLSFQLIGETFHPPEIIHFAGDSRKASEQIYAELRRAARAAADNNGGDRDARRLRDRLRSHGVQLWTSAVPQAVQSQFWDEADHVTAFTVLGEHDMVPWELLYPLNEGRDDRGFLAEWLPVVRRVFGQDRVRSLRLPGVAFVVPPGSPADASEEVTSLRARLGEEVADGGVLTERAALTALIEGGHAGLLHFACHNAFTGAGSCVTMADGPFDPIDLASAAQLRTLRPHRPLVFFNACRSAGEIDWFGESLGWAPQFLNAGAGAFVGTLWPVRSRSALQFAEAFYDQLISRRQPLGQASLAARQTIRDLHGGDPTWLAYAVYGSPAATAHTTA